MSSQDSALYNQDEGGVLQRLGSAGIFATRAMEGKLEATARINAEEATQAETKTQTKEGEMGIGIGTGGAFSGVVGLLKKRAMGIIKTKAKEQLQKLMDKAKAKKNGEEGEEGGGEEGEGAGGHPPAQTDPNSTPDNPAPNSADSSNPTYGNQDALSENPQTTDNLGSEGSEAPAREGDIEDVSVEQAPKVPPRTETTETPQPDIETPQIQITEPNTETPENMNPARSQPDEADNIDNASSQAELDPIESRIATRYNNLDSEAQNRANTTYNNSADRQQTPEGETQSLEDRKDNLSVREDSIQEQELNPDTTFKDPNLSIDQDDPAWSNTLKVSPKQTQSETYDNPAETQGTTTEGTTTTIQEADSVAQEPLSATTQIAGRSGDITTEAIRAPNIPARNIPAPEPAPVAPTTAPTVEATEGTTTLESQISSTATDTLNTFKTAIGKQLGMSDDDVANLTSKIGSGVDVEDLVTAGSSVLDGVSGAMGGIMGGLGAAAEVLGPLSLVAGVGMGIWAAIKGGEQEESQAKKTTEYTADLQNLSNSTALQTGSIAMPTMDTSQFRTGGMMNF